MCGVAVFTCPLNHPFWEIQKSNMADSRWPPFKNHYVITTSYDAITSCCGSQRKFLCTNYLSSKSHCHSFYNIEVMERGGWGTEGIIYLLCPSGSENLEKTGSYYSYQRLLPQNVRDIY